MAGGSCAHRQREPVASSQPGVALPDMAAPTITIRVATDDDRDAIVALCRASLGWSADDPNEAFFTWKHDENWFGRSPSWVAESDGRLVGLRVFLRWQFRDRDGSVVSAVRAVDTATHPDAQGQGIFRRLTLGALPDLREMGVDFVFNTPNTKSRPGYLKMGWGDVGSAPVALRIAGPRHAPAVLGARAAAEKWSRPTEVGVAAADAFADTELADRALARSRPAGITTDRSAGYLRWRYSFGPLHYRVVPAGPDGLVVFRLRRRGAALEATISETLGADGAAVRRAVGDILRSTGADYAITGGHRRLGLDGFAPAPRLGPALTWKPLVRPGVPALADLDLALGDLELF